MDRKGKLTVYSMPESLLGRSLNKVSNKDGKLAR